jgi:DNA-binding SARP family transcriptional activator
LSASLRRGQPGSDGGPTCASPPTLLLLGSPKLRQPGALIDLPLARWTALLAYLARGGGWVRREVLATLFWPEHDDHGANLNLRQTLQTIVRSPAGVALEREPTRVRWAGSCDAEAFDALVREQAWASVVRAYGGAFLDGLDVPDVPTVQEWIDAERTGLHARWRTAALLEGRAALAEGRCLDVLPLAERLCRTDAFDEEALRLLLEASVRCGDRTRAERTFAGALRAFERELGVEPDPETMALARTLGLAGRRG